MSASTEERVRARKDWLKRLAAERRSAWMIAVRPRALDGTTRIHTRAQVLHLEDGVVAGVFSADEVHVPDSPLVGMRIVAWVGDDNRQHPEFVPGARAVFWRRESDGERTALALTGRVISFASLKRPVTGSITLPTARTAPSRRSGSSSSVRSDPRPRSGVRLASRA